MQKFQDTFETRKRPFISAFSICMTVPLSANSLPNLPQHGQKKKYAISFTRSFFLQNFSLNLICMLTFTS